MTVTPEGVAVTTDPADGMVVANGEVKVTFTGEPSAADKEFTVVAKDGDADKVTITKEDAKNFKVVVKAAAEVIAKEVAKVVEQKIKLTVTAEGGVAVTTDPADGMVVANGEVTVTFTGEPSAADKEFTVEAKEGNDTKVTITKVDAKNFKVVVKEAAEVIAKEVAKAAPQPETPKFDITSSLNGATVEVKDGETVLDQEALKNIEAGKNLIIKVTVPEGKELVKVEIKKGEELTELTAQADGSYKYTTTADAVVLVVTTKEKEAPAPAGPGFTVVANGATVKVVVNGKEVKPADYNKIAAGSKLEITITPAAKKAIDKVTVKADGDAKETELKADKNGKYGYTLAKKATLTVKVKDATPVEDAVLAAVSVYPNPFVGQLVVANTAEVAKVALVNAQGVVVRTVLPNGANELRLAVEDLPAGVYVLVLERADARKAIRLVK